MMVTETRIVENEVLKKMTIKRKVVSFKSLTIILQKRRSDFIAILGSNLLYWQPVQKDKS